jgi:ribosome-associated protein
MTAASVRGITKFFVQGASRRGGARSQSSLVSRLTNDGVIVIAAQRFRSQERNRQDALDRLVQLVAKAAQRPKKRIATRPTLASKKRRVDAKVKRGETKRLRTGPVD